MPRPFSPAKRKFGEVIVYVARRCENDPHFGAVKLAKILFYADFIHYSRTGALITGQAYTREDKGPLPADFYSVIKGLNKDGSVTTVERDHFGKQQKHTVARREPDLQLLTGPEVATLSEVIALFEAHNAKQLSDLSHHFVGWKVYRKGEVIPPETAFFSDRPLDPSEEDAFRSMLADNGLLK